MIIFRQKQQKNVVIDSNIKTHFAIFLVVKVLSTPFRGVDAHRGGLSFFISASDTPISDSMARHVPSWLKIVQICTVRTYVRKCSVENT